MDESSIICRALPDLPLRRHVLSRRSHFSLHSNRSHNSDSHRAAEGEAAGAASSPSQKISYITGKWQIMRQLGRYRDSQGAGFRLGAFHDQLISYGTLPLSVIEWLMVDDESSLREALK